MEPGSFGPFSRPEYLSEGDKVNQLEQQMKRMQQKIGSLEEKYGLKAEEFKEKELKQQENIRLLSENIKMKDEKIEHLQSQKAKLEEKANELREKAKENELLKQKIQSLEEEKLKLEKYPNPSEYQLQEKLALAKELNELEAKYNKEKEALEKELNCVQEEKQKIEGKLEKVIEEKNQFRYQLMKANEELEELRASYKKQKDIQSSLENQIKALKKELENSKHRQDPELEEKLRQLRTNILQQIEVLKTQEKPLQEKRQELKKEINDINVEKGKLQEALDELEPKEDKLQSTLNEKRSFRFEKWKEQESLKREIDLYKCKKDMLEDIQKQLKSLNNTPEDMLRQKCNDTIDLYRSKWSTANDELSSRQRTKEKIEQGISEVEKEIDKINREWMHVFSKKCSAEGRISNLDRHLPMQQKQVEWVEHQIQVLNENKGNLEKNLKRVESVGQTSTVD